MYRIEGARLPWAQGVVSSNPTAPTKKSATYKKGQRIDDLVFTCNPAVSPPKATSWFSIRVHFCPKPLFLSGRASFLRGVLAKYRSAARSMFADVILTGLPSYLLMALISLKISRG